MSPTTPAGWRCLVVTAAIVIALAVESASALTGQSEVRSAGEPRAAEEPSAQEQMAQARSTQGQAAQVQSTQEQTAQQAANDAAGQEKAVAQDAAAAPTTTLFPPWRLTSTRNVDLRLRPNAGLRLPALFPNFSPVAPDYVGGATTKPWSITASLAALGIDGERESAKFQEFRNVRSGAVAGVEAHVRHGHQLLNLVGRHLGLDDQDLAIDGGRAGKYLLAFGYDETPHNFSFNARSLYAGIGTGELTVSDRIQTELQRSTSSQEAAERIRAFHEESAQSVDLALRRQKVGLDFTLVETYPLVIRASASNESRDGERPWSASFGFGNFVEIPWPVKYDTREVRVTAEYAKPESRLYANGTYRLSLFDNHIGALRFDNPYRVTDSSVESVAANVAAGPSTGLIDLYPSNDYHEATVTSVLSRLPRRTSLSGLFSFGFLRQNDPLVPFSTNTSIVRGGPGNPPFTATDPASLPRATAETAMNTTLAQVRLTAQPANRLRLVGQYRFYNLANNETPFTIPAFVREDADVRRPATPGGTYAPVLLAYNRHTASAEGSLNLTGDTRLAVAYTFERMNRAFREVAWMNDNRVKVSLDTRAASWLDLKASYERSVRDTSEYIFNQFNIVQGNPLDRPALPFLRKFDEAGRNRDEAQVIATTQVTGALSFSGMALYGRDDFSKSPFGLLEDTHRVYSTDASYMLTERLSLYGSYSFERYNSWQRARQFAGDTGPNPPTGETGIESASNWDARPRDDIHTAGLGFEAYLVPERLRFNVAYSYSRTDGLMAYTSPVGSPDLNAFEPAPFTDVDDVEFHSVNPELEYRIGERLALTAAYLFEKYTISDFNYPGFTFTPRDLAGRTNAGLLMGGFLFPPFDVNVFYLRVKLGF